MPGGAAFDTLAAAETMAEAGIEEPHAKAIAGAMRDSRAGLATGSDIRRLEDKIEGCATKAEVVRIERNSMRTYPRRDGCSACSLPCKS